MRPSHLPLVSQVLQSTIEGYKAKLKDTVEGKKICDARIEELQEEVKRLSARCKELVQQGELTSEVGSTSNNHGLILVFEELRCVFSTPRRMYHERSNNLSRPRNHWSPHAKTSKRRGRHGRLSCTNHRVIPSNRKGLQCWLFLLILSDDVFTHCSAAIRSHVLFGQQERVRIEKAMREQHRLADQQKVQATETRLAGLEAEQQKLLTRVLGAEEEAARQR